jgi:hypothetical protein
MSIDELLKKYQSMCEDVSKILIDSEEQDRRVKFVHITFALIKSAVEEAETLAPLPGKRLLMLDHNIEEALYELFFHQHPCMLEDPETFDLLLRMIHEIVRRFVIAEKRAVFERMTKVSPC